MGRLFGTDGVRGLANKELTPQIAFELGRASTYVITKELKSAPKIVIGMDTRISGDMLESALIAGMCSLGAMVYTVGIIPTPAISFLVRKEGFDAGVMISASHNPMQDNGIKFFDNKGYKLSDGLENKIEDIILNNIDLPTPIGREVGHKVIYEKGLNDYIEHLVSTFEKYSMQGLRIAIDCANGATYKVAPIVFERLGAEVMPINNEPTGTNINDNCGSTHMESLVEFVKEKKADIGIAYDGDGDRCLVVDETGKTLNGDEIMSIFGHYMKEKNILKGNTIVATVMSNLGLIIMGKETGINIEQTTVGDRYVLERMVAGCYSLGGEQSGHIIFLEHNTTGDGLFASLMMLSIMIDKKQTLSQLNTKMELLPQVLVNARVQSTRKNDYLSVKEIKDEVELLEKQFKGEGRVLIRPSGTEPLVRVMIEGRDKIILEKSARKLADLIEKMLG